jgi:alpha-glucosidase
MIQMKFLFKYIFLFIVSFEATSPLLAQVQDAGKVISFTQTSNGIKGKTATAQFDVIVYNDNIIRFRITKEKTFNTVHYALANDQMPSFRNFKISSFNNTIIISTAAMLMELEKEPNLRVTFKNINGDIINEDVKNEGAGTSLIGNRITTYKKLQEAERFVGLGEVIGNLDKRGSGFSLNNTDTYKYGDPRLSMYISIPFYIGIHHRQVYGLFYNNTYKTFFNFGLSTPFASITAEGGDADYFFIYDTSVSKILEHYSFITGKMPLPPMWSMGYQQSRCSYYPQEKVEWLAETFRKKQIPIDGIVLDADYQLNYQPFRTNKERFPDMPGLSASMSKKNIELTASVYPGVKIDSTYESYNDGLQKDVFIKYSNGSLFKTEIAPLKIVLPDYTNPKTRTWWIDKMKWMQDNGISGYWNDMDEPAVRGSYLPDNLQFNFEGRKANALEAKNIYGFLLARSSYDAGLKYRNGKRPFILTRSAFAGVQRYSAVWSGDNTASDEGLLSGVLLNSQMSLSGILFVGPDLGGYIGDGTKDLYKRWIEVGIFSPYVRNHKEFFATANEPWSYGEEAEAISKNYIGFRYRLMPYIYSKFYEASKTGMPITRSLCINDPFDAKVYDNLFQYQFLFGDALMITPVTSKETSKNVYLPKGQWFDLFTDEMTEGEKEIIKDVPIYQIPIYVKASSIIPMQSQVQSTKEKPSDTLYIHLYNGKEKNEFVYYEDEGDGFDYQKGFYCRKVIDFFPAEGKMFIHKQEGSFVSKFTKIQFIFHGFSNELNNIRANHTSMEILNGIDNKVLDPLEFLSEIYDPGYFKSLKDASGKLKTKSIIINNTTEQVLLQW